MKKEAISQACILPCTSSLAANTGSIVALVIRGLTLGATTEVHEPGMWPLPPVESLMSRKILEIAFHNFRINKIEFTYKIKI